MTESHNTPQTVLVVLDTPREGLRSPLRELLTIARGIGSVTAVALEEPSRTTIDDLSRFGATRLLVADFLGDSTVDAHLTPVAAEAVTAAVDVAGADVVLLTATFVNREIGARVAFAMGAGIMIDAAQISLVEGVPVGSRRVFAGSWDVSCIPTTERSVFTVRANSVVATPVRAPQSLKIDRFTVTPTAAATAAVLMSRTMHVTPGHDPDRPALAEAAYVVAGGRGTQGDFGPVEDLADALGGAVGATRDAVDEGWVGHDAQIGQTGVTIVPRVYIGAGISGAPHHRGGMQASKVIIAVNNDPFAPIFETADFGVVGDLSNVLPQAAAAIREYKARKDSSAD
jgi:electron transfer flavoprotein alpha subunit